MSVYLGIDTDDALELPDLVLSRLRATGETVLDGKVETTPPGRYVVFYDEQPAMRPSSLAGDYRRGTWTFRLVCVGRDAAEARYEAKLASALVTGWRPRRGDKTLGQVVPVPDGAPILRDESVPGDIRFSRTLIFRLHSSSRRS